MKFVKLYILIFFLIIIISIFAFYHKKISNSPSEHIYFGTANGLIYKDNNLLPGNIPILSPDGYSVSVILMESGILYVGTDYGGVYKILNGIWYQIGNQEAIPFGHGNGRVTALAIYKDKIYASGDNGVDDDGGIVKVVPLTGGNWTEVGGGSAIPGGWIYSMVINEESIYIGGASVEEPAGGVVYVSSLVNIKWRLLGDVAIPNGAVTTIGIKNNKIYAGGYTADDSGKMLNGIVKTNTLSGENWEDFGFESNAIPGGKINTMLLTNNQIYIGGVDKNNNGIILNSFLTKESWSQFREFTLIDGEVNSMVFSHNKIYVGGSSKKEGILYILLDNKQYKLISSKLDPVKSVFVDNNKIFIGTTTSVLYYDKNIWNPVVKKGALANSAITGIALWESKIFASTNENIYVNSLNGWDLIGKNVKWQINAQINSIAVNKSGIYACCNESRIIHIAFDNNVWEYINPPKIQINSIALSNESIYLGGNDNKNGVVLSKSLFGGEWSIIANVEKNTTIDLITLNNTNIYVAENIGGDEGFGVIKTSSIFGKKWESISESLEGYGDGIGFIALSFNKAYARVPRPIGDDEMYFFNSSINESWQNYEYNQSYSTALSITTMVFSNN